MGKPTGFLEFEREVGEVIKPKKRIMNFQEFHKPLTKEKQNLQGGRCMECGVPFCQSGTMIGNMVSGCPLHNLIPEWNDLIYNGNWEQAYLRLVKTNCFPEFTSRVCPALCEAACVCNLNGKPVSTKENEYSIIEYGFKEGLVKPEPPKVFTGKRIAIIGSGPAGLAAAMQLNRRGHKVTVFERHDRIGGLLRYGIPNMKLDKKIIDRRIHILVEEGIEFLTNIDIGKDKKQTEQLIKQYDRILLTCGASKPRDIKAAGREAKGIFFAVDFLRTVTKSLLDDDLKGKVPISIKEKNVLVIGGGDTGNDCVGTAIRLGAKSVVQLEMLPKPSKERLESNPWPEWPKVLKTDYGQEEAIEVFGRDPRIYQTTVTEFVKGKNGEVTKVKLVNLEEKMDDKTGKISMMPVKGTERTIDADIVLIAAGFLGAEAYISEAFGVNLDSKNSVKTKEGSYETSVPKVYAAGDMRRGQSLVVWAIREGREAAKAIDESLMGYSNL